ncbi:helix-turn-helix domain-containing protein [Erythrobacter sp. SCSIO 43205]|uniref:helix-turn-helix domain-containing protein n=1 Tax=Erythrobacter sp. SCSIO 43205 TaxID=2779361 RepID=UPI001CA94367|nr:helix-turn-helix domain-containing protein [Erythrobacter sp. SCSIO 43205]UAB78330.1 helix-turn-helix domain-containing protein [Erythrobacter sp. SCSIO 43205]
MGAEEQFRPVGKAAADALGTPRQSVRAVFHAPPEQFAGCFTTFYQLKLDVADGGEVEDYLQPEWANLRFFGGSCPTSRIGDQVISGARFGVTGPSSLSCHFRLGTSRMWGIGLLPLGWARLIGADAFGYRNALLDGTKDANFAKFDCLSDLLCNPEADEEEQLAEIIKVMEQFMRPSRDDAKIVRVHDALVSGEHLAVADLADSCGMSIRTLERVCRRYFGFTPKRLMRRQRFTRTLAAFMLQRGSLWTQSMDEEYHDQAQFTREFSEFMTMTPSKYASLDHPILASFIEARARIWGSAAQALDTPTQSSGSGD